MNKYHVLFSGRQDGAIGKFERITVTVDAESIYSDAIVAALREQHGYETEHLVCRTLLGECSCNCPIYSDAPLAHMPKCNKRIAFLNARGFGR